MIIIRKFTPVKPFDEIKRRAYYNDNDMKNQKSSNNCKIKPKHKTNRVILSIRSIFRPKMRNTTRLKHPEEYYCCYYFNKKVGDGVELISKIEHSTRRAAASMLMELGMSAYMGRKLTAQIQDDVSEIDKQRFSDTLRQKALEQGKDISKFI